MVNSDENSEIVVMFIYLGVLRLHEVGGGGMCMCTQLLAMHAPSASTDTKAWGWLHLTQSLINLYKIGVTWRILAVPFSSVLVALVLCCFLCYLILNCKHIYKVIWHTCHYVYYWQKHAWLSPADNWQRNAERMHAWAMRLMKKAQK
jgi:hypothetical protein